MSEPIIDPDFPPDQPVPPVPEPVPGEEQPVVDGWTDAPVSGDRVNVFDAPIVAGDPAGARIEIRSTGFHAFNGVGTETAHIDGQEGVFAGGEFRTSDAMPGQVTLSDTAFHDPLRNTIGPGIRITPEDTAGTSILPGVGPTERGLVISGGTDESGARTMMKVSPSEARTSWYRSGDGAHVSVTERYVNLQTYVGGGASSGIWAEPTHARVSASTATGATKAGGDIRATTSYASIEFSEANAVTSSIATSSRQALLRVVHADGNESRLVVDSQGVRARSRRSGVWSEVNLETVADRLDDLEARVAALET